MLAARVRVLITTFWVGGLWAIGYVVAPTLFATLADRGLAGTIAGSLFHIEAWLSVGCALILLALARMDRDGDERGRRIRIGLVLAMLACTLIGYFGLQPFMAEIRAAAGPGGIADPDARMKFGILHGISSAIYLIQSLLGAALVFKSR
ncbi:DUF4149 domain-containing protein [Noviherbaspirillum massiliense]|uniref:DUF4149 domain-containing protein n=1 Tax=Noviherbaspirillum massiliense TaxID=1465823 RepID=UPI0004747C06|nr:DUF4149 domain-containing protein [Noviherbaspirillum massiliense]